MARKNADTIGLMFVYWLNAKKLRLWVDLAGMLALPAGGQNDGAGIGPERRVRWNGT
jgi:hypothetical protein